MHHHVDERVELVDLSRADSAFGRPTSDWPWMIWRCRLDSSTTSKSMMPSVPTPAAAGRAARASRAAGPHDQDLRVLDSFLPGHPDVWDDQVARVAPDLIDRQLGGGLTSGGNDTVLSRRCAFKKIFLPNGPGITSPVRATVNRPKRAGIPGSGLRREAGGPRGADRSRPPPGRDAPSARRGRCAASTTIRAFLNPRGPARVPRIHQRSWLP